MNTKLWQPIQLGDIKLNHRLAMAPMTRSRSTAQGVPTDLNAEDYAQRASMALIISAVIQEFRHAAAAAKKAGAEGVELHGANGYLIHQFLSDNANLRTDQHGGSIEKKTRFAVEVASAVADEIGPGRTGIRISPGNTFNDIAESDVYTAYGALIRELNRLGLAYLHVAHKKIHGFWSGVLVVNRGQATFRPE